MAHRVLILGKRGMLGNMVAYVLDSDKRFTVRGMTREEFDVVQCESGAGGKTPEVELAPTEASEEAPVAPGKHSMLRSARSVLDVFLSNADYVINCIGITAQHINDFDPISVARAIRVNAEFPHALAAAAGARGARVIHMSTDGVFSGTSSEPYGEDAIPDATDTYGRTKALGESAAPNVLNIRCSIIGPSPVKHEGLWEWVASQPSGATVDGYTNHLWHGVTTFQFVDLCRRIITGDARGNTSGVEGTGRAGRKTPEAEECVGFFDALRSSGHILHFAPNAPVTKVDLVVAIAAALGKRLTVRPIAHTQPIHRVLSMRPDVAEMLGAGGSIAEALRACAAIHA